MFLPLLDIVFLGDTRYKHSYLVSYIIEDNMPIIGAVVNVYHEKHINESSLRSLLTDTLKSTNNSNIKVIAYNKLN